MFKNFMVAGAAIILAVALIGCGQSKTEKDLAAQNSLLRDSEELFHQVRIAPTGDEAAAAAAKLRDRVGGDEQLPTIAIDPGEVRGMVADKYLDDAKYQLAILRDRKTGTDRADKARAEFYRAQKLSGRGLRDFNVSAKTVDALVAQANHRAEVANSPSAAAKNHPPRARKPGTH